jgi:formyltetrahydrofolate-dependent phosphoribosylglycinamide formyltransferase
MADPAAQRRRIVVLISGSGLYYPATPLRLQVFPHQTDLIASPTLVVSQGTNLQALIDAQNTPALPNAHIVLVLSNRKAAYGLTRAQSADPPIPTRHLALQPYLKAAPDHTRTTYDAEIARTVLDARPDIIVLAGWMHVFSEGFLDAVALVPVINLHPALPGAFDGTHAIERSYDAFQKGEVDRVGAMVHRVVKAVDRGEPVVVREVEIKKGEQLADYEERLHRTEWEIIVEATQKVLSEVP